MTAPGSTRLDAVNEILEAIGEASVDALDTGGTSLAADAERMLDREDRRIQGQGWTVNTETRDFDPDANDANRITLTGSTILNLTPANADASRLLVRRGDYLYDVDNQTDAFDDSVTLTVIEQQTFIDLPTWLKDLIIAQAAWRFARKQLGATQADQLLGQQLAMARAEARSHEAGSAHVNVLKSTDALRVKGNRYDWPIRNASIL